MKRSPYFPHGARPRRGIFGGKFLEANSHHREPVPWRLSAVLLVACFSSSKSSGFGEPRRGMVRALRPRPTIPMHRSSVTARLRAPRGLAARRERKNYPTVDWVIPFEAATGCKVNARPRHPPTRWWSLMNTRSWERCLASGDVDAAHDRLGQTVAPVNTALVGELTSDIFRTEEPAVGTRSRRAYGIPHGRAPTCCFNRTRGPRRRPRGPRVSHPRASVQGRSRLRLADLQSPTRRCNLMKSQPALGSRTRTSWYITHFKPRWNLLRPHGFGGTTERLHTKEASPSTPANDLIGTTWVISRASRPTRSQRRDYHPEARAYSLSDPDGAAKAAPTPNCVVQSC